MGPLRHRAGARLVRHAVKLYVLAVSLGLVSGWILDLVGGPMLVSGYALGVLTGAAAAVCLSRRYPR